MTLHNNGKYEVGYKVLLRKRPVRDVLTFTPPEGTLAPGATQKLEVLLKTAEELDLRLNTDVRVQFTELLTHETLTDLTMPVTVSCHAVFSQFTIVPNHGLNFGPMVYNSEKSRTFEISNTGEFEFRYVLYPEGEGPDAGADGNPKPDPDPNPNNADP